MSGQIVADFVLRDLYQTARIDAHFMGRSGLPEGGAALAPRTCALGPISRAAPGLSGRPLRRTGERGEMGVYPRRLVLAASRSAQAPRTEVTAR